MNINNHENSFLNSYNNTNVEKEKKIAKLVIFAATNDSVQFHEEILRIFLRND